ncbi:portal protein [Escherichia coli]|nr:hypothetical protein [Escherichia coli]MCN8204091.1 portal protein [Escherichia coli]HAI3384513.1 hypothetical protein [Escherichia coli]HAL0004651.1 hypothetical protein [Escherichia coli]HAP1523993.1 hypothetical protein [Escherichia coli]
MKKLNKELESLILEQVKQEQALAEDDHAVNLARFNEAYLYYTAQKPENIDPTIEGKTREYVEPVLFQTVKAAQPQLLDTFTEDDELAVKFRSKGFKKNPVLDAIITANINRIFLHEQDGYHTLEQLFKELLVVGDGFAKVFVDETTERDTDTLTDWVDVAEYMPTLAEGWEIELPGVFGADKSGKYKGFEWKEEEAIKPDPETMQLMPVPVLLIRGSIPLIHVDKKVKVEFCEPADLWFNTSGGSDFAKCSYLMHRIKTTVGDAEARGFDSEKLKNAAMNDKANKLPELYFSHPFTGTNSDIEDNAASVDVKQRKIFIYEHYVKSSLLDEKGQTKWYQVVTTENEVLRVEEISRLPFVHGQCETLTGSFWGRSLFDLAKPYQDALTLAQRLSQQVAKMTAYPAYQAVKGAYTRESLLQRRPGQVIEVEQMGAVQRFEPLPLDATFFTSLASLQDSMKQTLSSPAGAIDANQGIPQVAASTVAMSLSVEAMKGLILAKNIARTLVKPLYTLIYEIIKDEGFPLEDDQGQTVEGVPLPNVYEFAVDIFNSNDDLLQVTQLTQTAEWVAKMSTAQSPMITPQNIFEITKELCKRMDLDVNRFFSDPATTQNPEQAHKQALAEALQEEGARIEVQKLDAERLKVIAEINKLEAETDELIKDSHNTRVIKQTESLQRQAQIQSDFEAKRAATAVKADEVDVKRKAVNGEIILNAAKHQTDIVVNGIR